MRKLGKLGSAFILGSLLCLALFSTGAFAQSASYNNTANNVAQGVATHVWQRANAVAGNQRVGRSSGWGNYGWRGNRYGRRFTRFTQVTRIIRVTRMIRVTQVIRVTRVRVIRVTRMIRVTQFRRSGGCGGGC